MKIRYETTIDDLLAFARFHAGHSPAWKRQVAAQRYSIALLTAVCIYFFVVPLGWPITVAAIIALIAWFVYVPRAAMSYYLKHAKRMYGEGSSTRLIGWHELALTDEAIVETSDAGSTITKFSALDRVEDSEGYTFVYLTSVSAHVVPKSRISEGNHEAFISELRGRLRAAT